MTRGKNIITMFMVICLAAACIRPNGKDDPLSGKKSFMMVQCILTDTTNVQRAKLYYGTPGGDSFTPITSKDVLQFELLLVQSDIVLAKFEYKGDGIWETLAVPEDGVKYALHIVLLNGDYVYLSTHYPIRPAYIGDVRSFDKAYFPATDDTVNNVIWFPNYPESGRPENYVGEVQTPCKIYYFLGQPKGDGNLRYCDYVATDASNRANGFNRTSTSIWSLPCWMGDNYNELGWKVDRSYERSTYLQGIYVPSSDSWPSFDLFTYDLIGDYDVSYARKHLPGHAEDKETWAAYDEPLMIVEARIVDGAYDTWLQNGIKNGKYYIHDLYKLNLDKNYSAFLYKKIDPDHADGVYGLFGSESVIRYPLGLSKKDLAPPIELNLNK